MLKARVLLTAIAIALLCAGTRSYEASASSGASPDMILGTWHGTSNAKMCPETKLTFTRKLYTYVQEGKPYTLTVLGIAMHGNSGKEVVVMTNQEDVYEFSDHNHMAITNPLARCAYTRGG